MRQVQLPQPVRHDEVDEGDDDGEFPVGFACLDPDLHSGLDSLPAIPFQLILSLAVNTAQLTLSKAELTSLWMFVGT